MDGDSENVRGTLAQLEERMRRDVEDMVQVLVADIPQHVQRTVRWVFERSSAADGLDDEGVRELKQATQATSSRLTEELRAQLGDFETWTWDAAWELPRDPEDLSAHPRVAEQLGQVEESIARLLEEHGIPRADLGERGGYRLPTYFVAGHFMKSLVEDFWRALTEHQQLAREVVEADQAERRQARRDRWDNA